MLTVHDLMTITRAHESSLAKRLFLPRQYRTSLRPGDRPRRGEPGDARPAARPRTADWDAKTVVAPNGLSRNLIDTAARAGRRASSTTRFALVVGDLAPRKNVGMLLDLWPDGRAR